MQHFYHVYLMQVAAILLHETRSCPQTCSCFYNAPIHVTDCNSQSFTKVPRNIPEWTTEFRLDGNYLTVLDLKLFETRQYYEEMSLRYNQIDTIQIETRNVSKSVTSCGRVASFFYRLNSVNLKGNELRELPKCLLITWPSIKILNLNDNRITRFRDLNFAMYGRHTNSLEEIDLSGNGISQIVREDWYSQSLPLNRLRILNLSKNQIHTLESGVFTFLDELRVIDLGENKLGYDCSFFYGYNGYGYICNIIKFRFLPDFAFVTSGQWLEEINLSHNYLNWISENTFAGLTNIQKIDMSYNEIQCLNPATWSTCQFSILPAFGHTTDTGGYFPESRHFYARYSKNFESLRCVNIRNNTWMCDCKLKMLFTGRALTILSLTAGELNCDQPQGNKGRTLKSTFEELSCP